MKKRSSTGTYIQRAIIFTGLILAIVLFIPFPLDLSEWRTDLEQLILDKFEIPVQLNGEIKLNLGLYPSIELHDVSIPGPENNLIAKPITAQRLKAQISLPHLLFAHIHISELKGENIQLLHELSTTGSNWQHLLAAFDSDTANDNKQIAFSIKEVQLDNVNYLLNDELRGISFDSSMTRLSGSLPWKKNTKITAEGIWGGQHYQLLFNANSLRGILYGTIPWPLSLDLDIDKNIASMDIDAVFNPRVDELVDIEFKLVGTSLSQLEPLLQLELPPIGPYELEGKLLWSNTGFKISNLLIKIDQSSIVGTVDYQYVQQRPKLTIALTSPLLRVKDITSGEKWSWLQESGDNETNRAPNTDTQRTHLFDPEFFDAFDAEISLKMARLETKAGWVGDGFLNISIIDKQLKISPLAFHSGKSQLEFNYHLYPSGKRYQTVLDLEATQLDLQFLASLYKPDADFSGLLDMSVHFEGLGNNLSETAENADGHFRFALWPKEMDADFMDFWAVNLISFIVDGMGQQSKVNCIMVDFSLNDGLMKHNKLLLDTSHLRAEGKGEINLKNKKIKLKIYPKAKKTQWFSLETPVEIHGNIDDFNVKVDPKNVAGTVVRNIANLSYLYLPLLKYRNIDKNGRDVCQQLWHETEIN